MLLKIVGVFPEELKMEQGAKRGACPHCDGTGIEPEKGGKCTECNGIGWIEVYSDSTGGIQ